MKPYGDIHNDGMMQLSFTLPMKASPEAREAARILMGKMGFTKILIPHMEDLDGENTFFVAYGSTTFDVDPSTIVVPKIEYPKMNYDEVNEFIRTRLCRKVVLVGACIGSDAHTVGIDALFNMKGYAHDWGFERYPEMQAYNLRAQVNVEDLVAKIVEYKADGVLVSRIVTQRDEHIVEFKKLLTLLGQNPEVPKHIVKICGGPRVTHKEAMEWGYDAGFGPGTKPSEVASFIVHELAKRLT